MSLRCYEGKNGVEVSNFKPSDRGEFGIRKVLCILRDAVIWLVKTSFFPFVWLYRSITAPKGEDEGERARREVRSRRRGRRPRGESPDAMSRKEDYSRVHLKDFGHHLGQFGADKEGLVSALRIRNFAQGRNLDGSLGLLEEKDGCLETCDTYLPKSEAAVKRLTQKIFFKLLDLGTLANVVNPKTAEDKRITLETSLADGQRFDVCISCKEARGLLARLAIRSFNPLEGGGGDGKDETLRSALKNVRNEEQLWQIILRTDDETFLRGRFIGFLHKNGVHNWQNENIADLEQKVIDRLYRL